VDEYASILMRIDPEVAVEDVKIKGTKDWKKYEISLKMKPQITRNFAFGFMLMGKGNVWVNDLKIAVDGKDINKIIPIVTDKMSDRTSSLNETFFADSISDSQIKDLYDLGLIWGLLKYYHPQVAKGKFNWDNELINILPNILNANDKVQRDEVFVSWINSLGKFSENKKEKPIKKDIKLKPDLDWIENSGFSTELSCLLLRVKNAKRTGRNIYVRYDFMDKLEFKNEEPYSHMSYPDADFRLLSLFRYWNMIQYYFPYRYLIGEDWKNVLTAFIPKFMDTQNEKDYLFAVLELIGRIHDSHANINKNPCYLYWGNKMPPLELTFAENQPVISGFYDEKLGEESEMQIGDVITNLNYSY